MRILALGRGVAKKNKYFVELVHDLMFSGPLVNNVICQQVADAK